MKLPPPHVRAWYSFAFAAEVFSACALAIFIPITLEHLAREVGYLSPDFTIPCSDSASTALEDGTICKAHILGSWVDTASFSMYVKSVAVAVQALCIVSIGPLADSAYWRKRLLVIFAYTGSLSAILLYLLPPSPVLAAVLTVVGNASYATSIVCQNAFLPGLAKEDVEVVKAARGNGSEREEGEEEGLLSSAVQASSTQDLADTDDTQRHYAKVLSLTTSRLSSTGTALGFFSGVVVLALLTIPVTILHGSTTALRLAVGLTGVWWGVFTIPAWVGLPGGTRSIGKESLGVWVGWKRVGQMIRPAEMKSLRNLFLFLLAWIFLSDGFHTTTYTAILYASSTLRMSPSKIIIIGVLVQLSAVLSSIYCPRLQARLGYTNLRVLLHIIVLAQVLPAYACLGLILPFGGLRTEGEMYVAAAWFGMLYGPFNSYSRAVYAELIPPGHESSFFSLFSLTDKSASFLGPAIVGIISDLTGNIRLGFLFLLVLLILPVPVLLKVDPARGKHEVRAWAAARVSGGGEDHE